MNRARATPGGACCPPLRLLAAGKHKAILFLVSSLDKREISKLENFVS
jgi:hypothetical protein